MGAARSRRTALGVPSIVVGSARYGPPSGLWRPLPPPAAVVARWTPGGCPADARSACPDPGGLWIIAAGSRARRLHGGDRS
ncbi:hypothetical protein T261_5732 [Streptomyces lydicus]|nr:hypothetical protein T261_5732 [Streptomyces lydicus]